MEPYYSIEEGSTKATKRKPSVAYYTALVHHPLPEPNPHGLYFRPTAVAWRAGSREEAEAAIEQHKAKRAAAAA